MTIGLAIVSAMFLVGVCIMLMNLIYKKGSASTPALGDVENPKKKIKGESTLMPPDMKKILDRGKLIVGVYIKDRPPFFMTDDKGELYGFDISLAKDIAKNLNVDVEFNRKATTFNELLDMVTKGEVDVVISKFSRTFERSKMVRFSYPYINLTQELVVKKMEAVKNKIENYPMDYLEEAKVKIGVVKGTSFVEYSKVVFKNATIVEYSEWTEVVDALIQGEIVATLYDDSEVTKLVSQKPDIALYTSIFVLKDKADPIAIAVSWQSTHLLSWLDTYLNTYLETYQIKIDVNDLIKQYPEVYRASCCSK